MNPGNAFAMRKTEAGGKTNGAGATPAVIALQKKIETTGSNQLVVVSAFANRKEGGQDKSKQTTGEKRESGNGGGAKMEKEVAVDFAIDGIRRSFGDYFPVEESYCRVMY